MDEFVRIITKTWWGITLLCVVCVAVWVLLSALLYRPFFKRFYDIVLSFIAIAVFSPLLLLLTVVGAVAMRGNPFFAQKRPGRRKKLSKKQCESRGVPYGTYGDEKIIKLLKFRTMTCAKDKDGNLLPDADRLNKYGKLLRASSLDELPSLFNILIGDISIVGPRPQLIKDLWFMSDDVRYRHTVRPGLTGLAQVNGRNSISWEKKFEYDLKYIEKITIWRDIKILFQTVGKVLKRSGINREGTQSDLDYGDWLLATQTLSKEQYYSIMQKASERGLYIGQWRYYNHAWIPNCEPHITPDLEPLKNGELFRQRGVLARYTSDWDCKFETDWWFTIKDTPFNIDQLKAKRRYVIKQGVKNFFVRSINAVEYSDFIYHVAEKAFASYPESYRPTLNAESFKKDVEEWVSSGYMCYGAFFKENNEMAGYAVLRENGVCIDFIILKTVPYFEKYQVNAALVYAILCDCNDKLAAGYYICDGARNIQHQTEFPEYLQKYFMFRKAYCKLHIVYRPKYKHIVKLLYPVRKFLYKFDNIKKVHQINGVMKMEEIIRNQKDGV